MFKQSFSFRRRRSSADSEEGSPDAENRNSPEGSPSQALLPRPPPPRTHSTGLNSIDEQLVEPSRKSSLGQGDDKSGPDPLGLKVIHRPDRDRRVDIVFVHGLGGSSRMTWSKNHNLEYFWPLKFLPSEPGINEARISTFGYNANFRAGSGRTKMSILDFAKDLLYDLKYATDELDPGEDLEMGKRPIIFVVHSMGGLIVKEAYMQGQNDPTYESIIKAVSSILFLSTPHRGTNLADTLNRILQVSYATNPMQFIAELAAGSQTLQKLNEQFRHAASKLQIVSFYETRPTLMFKGAKIMVLEKESSILGYPGEISKPLDADHHGVCKYDGSEDPRYVTVRNFLRSLVGKARPKVDDRRTSAAQEFNFEEYLATEESREGDYNFFRDRWTSGTCEWILSSAVFTSWLEDNDCNPRVLWIHGNAASGKSILSSFVIDHLAQLGLPCQYFFVRYEDKKKRTLSLILRSLACQIARSIPTYADKLGQLQAAATDLKTADFRNIWQWLYKQSLFQLSINYPLYWVIDGIDEAETPEAVVKVLSDLHLTDIPIRVLLVSRRTHEISSAFMKLARQVRTETIHTEGNQEDFLCYIKQELDVAGHDSYREQIIAQILERARGNFLWVHLAVDRINKCHTKPDVEHALKDLPPGMGALYERMAKFVQTHPNKNDQNLAENILAWATCAHRPLSAEELCDALGNRELQVLEIHRTIGDLCGGFVVVDKEGKVAMIHATAREYLLGGDDQMHPLAIDKRTTNDKLFKTCMGCLMAPTLRSQISRNLGPAFLDYATSSWFTHLSNGSATLPTILETLLRFLRGPHILIWINVAAKRKQLKALVVASRHLTDLVLKLRKAEEEFSPHHESIDTLAAWATDLVKIVGKFGNSLSQDPDSIYKLIPPFCPEESAIYQQFGRSKGLHVSGFTTSTWDDCLARFALEQGAMASAIHAAGSRITILTNMQKLAHIFIYNSVTFEEERRITHPERVFQIQLDKMGELLVSYGHKTTRVWEVSSGECIKVVANPPKLPRPHTLLFQEPGNTILVGSEDRCVRSITIDDKETTEWKLVVRIDEQCLDDAPLNAPTCSALSPAGNMIAFGYRGHPLTVWELDPPILVSQCNITTNETNMTIRENLLGEVVQLIWHPFSGEVLGLHREGLLFRWHPYEEEPSVTAHTGAHYLSISRDGSLVATGDTVGTVKIYATSDLSLLYQLSSQNPVLHLTFSTDSRRFYDIRGSYGNVWEPNTLVRLADTSEYPDHNSDAWSDSESLAKLSLHTEHHFPRVDNIIVISGQLVNPLYCYGTEDGAAVLCEVGTGKEWELERLTSYMSIEQVAWSDDGRSIAISDLSGRIFVKTIAREGQNWQVCPELQVKIPSQGGHISQLLFHPTNNQVFAATPNVLYTVDVGSHALFEFKIPAGMAQLKWICHPTLPGYLLGFGNTNVHVISWENLRPIEIYTYSPFRIGRTATLSSGQARHGRGSTFRAAEEILGRLISHVDSPDIILEVSSLSSSGRHDSEYLIFKVADIKVTGGSDMKLGSGQEVINSELAYTLLPLNVASRIREPLAFLSSRRLLFLDVDRWICTWRLPYSNSNVRRGSEPAAGGIEQYYFLPGDWVTTNEAQLCSVMPDGTLLCPRIGDVATVQCSRLKK